MAYTEIKVRNKRTYYYRVVSIREHKNVKKRRVYLGSNLSSQNLLEKELAADEQLRQNHINISLQSFLGKIIKVLKKYGVKKASIFGSYARGEQKKKSDIDILIEPPKRMGLKFVSLALEMEKRLGKKVDLITYTGISPHLKAYVLKDERRIL